jgi:hypothetical protein
MTSRLSLIPRNEGDEPASPPTANGSEEDEKEGLLEERKLSLRIHEDSDEVVHENVQRHRTTFSLVMVGRRNP